MAREHWKIADLPWDQFNPAAVKPDLVKIAKAAALVEYNGNDYATYLCNVFHDDPVLQEAARAWAIEEVQHGEALGAWAKRADPTWDFESSVRRFREGYKLNLTVNESVRGSRSGELIARCIVETGTSNYYTALADATEEPVLKALSLLIAADEHRHYKLFYDHLGRYLKSEKLNRFQRLKVGLSRIQESEDDELAYAYYCANTPEDTKLPYTRDAWSQTYMRQAYNNYREEHVERMLAMIFKACGLRPHSPLQKVANKAAWFVLQRRLKTLVANDAAEAKAQHQKQLHKQR